MLSSTPRLAWALLLLPGLALAGQLIEGDTVRIHYSDDGRWNDPNTGVEAGLQLYDSIEGWLDMSWPGTPWAEVSIGYTRDGEDVTVIGGEGWSVESVTDLSTKTRLSIAHRLTTDDLQLDRIESWDTGAQVIHTEWTLTNTGKLDLTELRLTHSLDADPDADALANPQPLTYNDTLDLDGDGVADWVQSEGVITGVTVGFGLCDLDDQELGHHASNTFSADPDLPLTDAEGALQDYTMNVRHTVGTLKAGASVDFSLLTALGSTAEVAQDGYLDAREGPCGIADYDRDNDGYDAVITGGPDCDDTDETVNPGAEEIWYDGVDQDCDGNDTDADGDGIDAVEVGGVDCDDEDAAIYPEAVEVWYDGVDQDCDGNDADADGDGFVGPDEDCDDGNEAVYPDAEEVWYDGVDGNCTGDNDLDADGDGYAHEDYGGDDCNDFSAVVHPGAEEVWYDGVDSDCSYTSDYDVDGDGHDAARYDGDDCHDDDASRWECPEEESKTCGSAGGGGWWLMLLPLVVWRREHGVL
ncbi:MAG: (2Fe-2S) ferredoxin [Myxococcota bacterium]|jgi:(2Fe-2S) ferredoxin